MKLIFLLLTFICGILSIVLGVNYLETFKIEWLLVAVLFFLSGFIFILFYYLEGKRSENKILRSHLKGSQMTNFQALIKKEPR